VGTAVAWFTERFFVSANIYEHVLYTIELLRRGKIFSSTSKPGAKISFLFRSVTLTTGNDKNKRMGWWGSSDTDLMFNVMGLGYTNFLFYLQSYHNIHRYM